MPYERYIKVARDYLKQAGTNGLAAQTKAKAENRKVEARQKSADVRDFITAVDLQNKDLALEMLAPFVAEGHFVMTEENLSNLPVKEILERHEYVWLIDPIDGTEPFKDLEPTWGVLLVFYHNGKAVFAGSYAPALNWSMWITETGGEVEREGVTQPIANILPARADSFVNISKRQSLEAFTQKVTVDGPYTYQPLRSAAAMTINLAAGEIALMAMPQKSSWWDGAVAFMLMEQKSWLCFFTGSPEKTYTKFSPEFFRPNYEFVDNIAITTQEVYDRLHPELVTQF